MINGEKIGVGIITCNRPHLLKKCVDSIPLDVVDSMIIVNDGKTMDQLLFNEQIGRHDTYEWIETDGYIGVGKSKNIALNFLLNDPYECYRTDHMFLIEDDIFIQDPKVFEKYIEASKITGIQHFNYSQHGVANKKWEQRAFPDVIPNPRVVIDYGSVKIPLYPHCVGAFSYYSRRCLKTVGLLDERYYNACEHVDHTYEIIKAGMHPPYWYFADIENSWTYLGDKEWSIEQSSILSNPNARDNIQKSDKIFLEKHGHLPTQTPFVDEKGVGKQLKQIREKYGRTNNSNV